MLNRYMGRGKFRLTCLLLVAFATISCSQNPGSGTGATAWVDTSFAVATPPENTVAQTVNVDPSNPAAADSNSGTPDSPFMTLGAAVAYAANIAAGGSGVEVLVHDGVYREQVLLPQPPAPVTAPLVIQAVNPGHAIVSGSDVWTGWQQQGGGNQWTHAWPYAWGEAPYPSGWQGNVVLEPIVRRSEMVFVNGAPLTEVLAPNQLSAGTFYVSESAGVITVQTAPGVDISSSMVEVAVRWPVLEIQGANNIALRGLTFQHANSPLPNGGVVISDSATVLVDNCVFTLNNWDGLDVLTSSDVTVRQTTAVRNGGTGIGGYQLLRMLMDGNTTSSNNWRGAAGGFTGWDVAGSKLGLIHNGIIRNQSALNNQARGLWLDSDNVNVTIDGAKMTGNNGDGIFLEASQGPLEVVNGNFTGNTGGGIAGSNTSDATVIANTAAGNAGGQLLITGATDRDVTNWETNATEDVRIARWTVRGNLFTSENPSQPWLASASWSWFLASLASDWNVWSYSGDPSEFVLDGGAMPIGQWRAETGDDYDSIAAPVSQAKASFDRMQHTMRQSAARRQ